MKNTYHWGVAAIVVGVIVIFICLGSIVQLEDELSKCQEMHLIENSCSVEHTCTECGNVDTIDFDEIIFKETGASRFVPVGPIISADTTDHYKLE